MVFSGSTGKIFGPRGAQIAAIRNASRCKDIQLPPPRTTDQPRRPNPRAEVALVLVGTARQISKAKILIQQVVDEWVCLSFSLPLSLARSLAYSSLVG
jgi:hypothetical protein